VLEKNLSSRTHFLLTEVGLAAFDDHVRAETDALDEKRVLQQPHGRPQDERGEQMHVQRVAGTAQFSEFE